MDYDDDFNGLVCWGKSTPETHGFLPSNIKGFPVNIFPSSNSMTIYDDL